MQASCAKAISIKNIYTHTKSTLSSMSVIKLGFSSKVVVVVVVVVKVLVSGILY